MIKTSDWLKNKIIDSVTIKNNKIYFIFTDDTELFLESETYIDVETFE